jgi:hypothetical protein
MWGLSDAAITGWFTIGGVALTGALTVFTLKMNNRQRKDEQEAREREQASAREVRQAEEIRADTKAAYLAATRFVLDTEDWLGGGPYRFLAEQEAGPPPPYTTDVKVALTLYGSSDARASVRNAHHKVVVYELTRRKFELTDEDDEEERNKAGVETVMAHAEASSAIANALLVLSREAQHGRSSPS